MNALIIADLNVSQDLDRKALAAVVGGAGTRYDIPLSFLGTFIIDLRPSLCRTNDGYLDCKYY
jgi:hypothetical protein